MKSLGILAFIFIFGQVQCQECHLDQLQYQYWDPDFKDSLQECISGYHIWKLETPFEFDVEK